MNKLRSAARSLAQSNRTFKQALKTAGIVIPPEAPAPVDLAAVRASIRKAVVEAEVERRVGAGSDRWLRQAELEQITGLRRTTLWKLRREDPTFPKAHTPTGGRAIRFRESEVRRWMADRARDANGKA